MKTLLIVLTFLSMTSFGQIKISSSAPTTLEEYNYLTKGYRVQIESGLDMKKGYNFIEIGSVNENNYNFQFKMLVREERKELAAVLTIVKSGYSGKTYYLCIPQNNKELMLQYFSEMNNWDGTISKSYSKVLSVYFSQLIGATLEMDKQMKKN